MVSCKHCTIQNSLDSTYCKRCGTVLDDADVQEATVKLTALIADGNRLFADGRTDEAMLVAENAVMSNPSSPAALSLKGMCHERLGQISEALECFERVVQLNPDSTLDRLKINDLRNQLVALSVGHHQPKPDRRLATVAAVAAAFLVIAGGALVAKAGAQARQDTHNRVASNADQLRDNQQVTGFTGGGQSVQPPANSTAAPTNTRSGGQPPVHSGGGGGDSDISLPDAPKGNGLPRPEEGQNGFGNIPIHVEVPDAVKNAGKNNPAPPGASTTTNPIGRDINQDPPPQDDPPKDEHKSDPGIVEISVSKGGGTGATMGNGKEALIHTARNQFQLGNYDAAARTFSRALRSGADQGSTNQRLGQCYERLGQTNEAVQAYQRAAAAYEAELKSGGDNPRVSAALDSCRQALKVLQGK